MNPCYIVTPLLLSDVAALSALHGRGNLCAAKHFDHNSRPNALPPGPRFQRNVGSSQAPSINTNCNVMTLFMCASSVRTLLSKPSSPFLRQCRSIHLWYAATAKTALGNHGIKALKPAARYEDPAKIEIDLWVAHSNKRIGRITLKEALTHHIKPGKALLPPRPPRGPTDKAGNPARYFLVDLDTEKGPKVSASSDVGRRKFIFTQNQAIPSTNRLCYKRHSTC